MQDRLFSYLLTAGPFFCPICFSHFLVFGILFLSWESLCKAAQTLQVSDFVISRCLAHDLINVAHLKHLNRERSHVPMVPRKWIKAMAVTIFPWHRCGLYVKKKYPKRQQDHRKVWWSLAMFSHDVSGFLLTAVQLWYDDLYLIRSCRHVSSSLQVLNEDIAEVLTKHESRPISFIP